MDLRLKKILVVIMSVGFLCALLIVAYVESGKLRPEKRPSIRISKENRYCIDCHKRKGVAPKTIEQWEMSLHAVKGVGCVECHIDPNIPSEQASFDAFKCPESEVWIGRHPTPKDCARCHKKEVEEFTKSKHAYAFYLFANADRAVFEPPIATRHGCEQCHNIGNPWPDGSVGECDACHAKHRFSKAVARNPYTCGECHVGPDHPHIEIYLESKHGNIFATFGKDWDLNYSTKDQPPIPIEAPVCTTCHMDGAPGQSLTHNISARLAFESQSPWSFRSVFFKEELGSWQDRRARMESICLNCHARDFVKTYFLIADLCNLQYNEIRRVFVYWNKKLTANGLVKRLKVGEKFFSNPVINGWDEVPEQLMYHAWHHQGRRFRHGAEMMGADYTQWHGIWELQHMIVEMITWAAEHGDAEAEEWLKSTDPTKFYTYKLYDFPGNAWGINTEQNKLPYLYKTFPDYWERVRANVKYAYEQGLLSKEQWELWEERYKKKDHYLGIKYKTPDIIKTYREELKKDTEAFKKQAVKLNLPSPSFYEVRH